jgi:hypothetical protein
MIIGGDGKMLIAIIRGDPDEAQLAEILIHQVFI